MNTEEYLQAFEIVKKYKTNILFAKLTYTDFVNYCKNVARK